MTPNPGSARLKSATGDLMKTLGQRAVGSVGDRVTSLTDRLEDVATGNTSAKSALGAGKAVAEGKSPIGGALKGAASAIKDKIPGLGGGSESGGGSRKSPKATKATNIVEVIDVGVPVRVAYDQWTEFGAFPSFMKKVENVDAKEDTKLDWKAQIFWSHREWEATILEQVPDERIVWRSKGPKGHPDGAVTFHELTPDLTRIIVVLEYYPQGLFERTGNLWRAQGRRTRVELKHFQRHVMTRTILDPEELEGWRGTIEDGEVVTSHEDALAEEEQQEQEQEQGDGGDEEYDEESAAPEDEYEDEDADQGEEYDEDSGEEDSGAPEDEYEDEGSDQDEEYDEESAAPEDEYEDEDSDQGEAAGDEEPAGSEGANGQNAGGSRQEGSTTQDEGSQQRRPRRRQPAR